MQEGREGVGRVSAELGVGFADWVSSFFQAAGVVPSAMVASFLEERFARYGDALTPEEFGEAATRWLAEWFCADPPVGGHAEIAEQLFHIAHKRKTFFASLLFGDEEGRRAMLAEYFAGDETHYQAVVEQDLIPKLAEFFRRAVDEFRNNANPQGQERPDWDEAISRFVDDGLFLEFARKFQEQEGLEELDEELCAKVFYRVFKEHFDTRKGLGLVEMIEVGEKHPAELKKMSLMQEYDDIRALLLKLQLTGKIRSRNYR